MMLFLLYIVLVNLLLELYIRQCISGSAYPANIESTLLNEIALDSVLTELDKPDPHIFYLNSDLKDALPLVYPL